MTSGYGSRTAGVPKRPRYALAHTFHAPESKPRMVPSASPRAPRTPASDTTAAAEAPDSRTGAEGPARPPRAPRLSREELRTRVLAAAHDMLGDDGLTVGLHHLNMEELIRRVGVPRSSAFAAFGGKEQLMTDLMVDTLRPRLADGGALSIASDGSVAEVRRVLAENAHRMTDAAGRPDPAGGTVVLREAVRVALVRNFHDTMGSSEWKSYMALSVSVNSLPENRREVVGDVLRETDTVFLERMARFYEQIFAVVHRRPRPGVTYRQLVTAGASVVEGLVSRALIGSESFSDDMSGPGLDGDEVPWSLVATAFWALVEGLSEEIPVSRAGAPEHDGVLSR